MVDSSLGIILQQVFPFFGLAGSVIILAGCVAAGLIYTGRAGERYSPLNHFISELGDKTVSKNAAAFNIPVSIGGALFIPFILGVGMLLDSWWGILGMAAGLIAAVSAIFVGIYSMDRLDPHRRAAMTFFRSGLLTTLFFTIAVFIQPAEARRIPLTVNIIGIIAVSSYIAFLIIVSHKTDKNNNQNYILDPTEKQVRPKFWRTPFLEWLLFIATIGWFLSVSLIQIL